jgi:hypothetical protein
MSTGAGQEEKAENPVFINLSLHLLRDILTKKQNEDMGVGTMIKDRDIELGVIDLCGN